MNAPSLGLTLATVFAFSTLPVSSEDSASGLAAKLAEAVEDNESSARLRLNIKSSGGGKSVLQLRVKTRRTTAKTEVVYQVLYPKERKGECILLKRTGTGAGSGHLFRPPESMTALKSSDMGNSLLGSDLAYQDVFENFFRWQTQSIVGKEKIGRVDCVILESKPGSKDSTTYGSVKCWVDPKKLVAMRVEKYDKAGKLACKIETDKVARDDNNRHTPVNMTVRRTGSSSVTVVEGSNIRHDIILTDRDFAVPTFTDLKIPRSR